MIELQHRIDGCPALDAYCKAHPNLEVNDFESQAFNHIKPIIKSSLNTDQGGLCVYCERPLDMAAGQIEHIRPKAGQNAHPELCFSYTNYAHSCINNKTCGQKKKNGILPIEPEPGCNKYWALSTDGIISPLSSLSRRQRHTPRQALDMLGLNRDTTLVQDRKKATQAFQEILQQSPEDADVYLAQRPFRYILDTL